MITAIKSGHNPLVAGRTDNNPEGFINGEVKVYRIIDGVKTLVRTESPFPADWKGREELVLNPAKHDTTRKRNCRPQRPAPPLEELRQVYRELGPALSNVAKHYGAGFGTVRRWLREYGVIDVENRPIEGRGEVMSKHFDDLIREGRDTDAMRLFAREYYDIGKMGHTRLMLLERTADKHDKLKEDNAHLTEENDIQRASMQELSRKVDEQQGEIAGLKGEIEYLTSDERKEWPLDKYHATTERLWKWARETLTGEIADQFWGIAANGHLMAENPEYHQRINILRHKAKQAEAQVAKMQAVVGAARYYIISMEMDDSITGFRMGQAQDKLEQALQAMKEG